MLELSCSLLEVESRLVKVERDCGGLCMCVKDRGADSGWGQRQGKGPQRLSILAVGS